jgi:hypothetical protein
MIFLLRTNGNETSYWLSGSGPDWAVAARKRGKKSYPLHGLGIIAFGCYLGSIGRSGFIE